MAGIYNGHILEFPQIRVDCFTPPPRGLDPPWLLPDPYDPNLPRRPAPAAQLFLLTHVHTDHLIGLDNQFTGRIVCSPDTKRMLLRLEAEKEREHVVQELRETPRRKYDGLRAKVVDRGTKEERVIDRIEAVPYGLPRVYEIGYEAGKPIKVTITLLDANHCPGSTMFLITSPDHAVLHTGDIRADDLFLKTLRRNPAVGEFLTPTDSTEPGKGGRSRLDRIYLDTGAVMGTGDMPDKEVILSDLIDQMSLYPPDTVFFLNVWCFGWEDVVKEVARQFDSLVHVDRYKKAVYDAVQSDPFLSSCTTVDPSASRFHACERRAKCSECRTFDKTGQRVWNTTKRIVHVNMVEIKSASWEVDRREFVARLSRAAVGEGDWPFNIDCPFARHSPLPELQALVKMFRPNALSPNTMTPTANGLDYYLLPDLFQDCLSTDAHRRLILERDAWFNSDKRFGPTYSHNMTALGAMGLELGPPLFTEQSERDDRLVEPFEDCPAATIGATKRIRSAHATEQISRAGGFPRSSPTFMKAVQMALGGGAIPAGPFLIQSEQQLQEAVSYGNRGLCGGKSLCVDGSEYDTDEDSANKRRRRKIKSVSGRSPPSRSQRELAIQVKAETDEPVHVAGPPALTSRRDESGESPHKLVVNSTVPRVNTLHSTRTSRPSTAKRFLVNKEHLRALAMVAAEVDDL